MTHRSNRVFATLAASALLIVGSPVAVSSATGPHKQVGAGFGDCKNVNSAKHNGYDCPVPSDDNAGSTGGTDMAR
jgi:hypothetical protein